MHVPVMLGECLEYLGVRPSGVYLDATAGLGGHTGAIAERLKGGFVIANDRDAESLDMAKSNTAHRADRIRYHHGTFGELGSALAQNGVERVDGLLADLGVSRYQLTSGERGFSLMADGPLDMRMQRDAMSKQQRTAADFGCWCYPRRASRCLPLPATFTRRSRSNRPRRRQITLLRPQPSTPQSARISSISST